jgi:hypothetical protein
MKIFKLICLAFAAVVAVCAMTASAALADEWLADGAPIATPLHVDSEGELLLELVSSKIAITCMGTSLGTIGPGAADSTETVTTLSCKEDPGTFCGGNASATAENTPWKTELLLELDFIDDVTNGGKGEPGYSTTCSFLSTLCEGPTHPLVENLPAEGGKPEDVDAIYNGAASGETKCTNGEKGIIVGSTLIFGLGPMEELLGISVS